MALLCGSSVQHVARVSSVNRPCFTGSYSKLPLSQPLLQRAPSKCQGFGKDAAEGWLDVSKLVSGGGKAKGAYDKLANMIGKDVHVDVNGWHLFLRDITATKGVKMHEALAQAVGPKVGSKGYSDSDLEALLSKVPLELGKGKVTVSLLEAIPQTAFRNFSNAIKDYSETMDK